MTLGAAVGDGLGEGVAVGLGVAVAVASAVGVGVGVGTRSPLTSSLFGSDVASSASIFVHGNTLDLVGHRSPSIQ